MQLEQVWDIEPIETVHLTVYKMPFLYIHLSFLYAWFKKIKPLQHDIYDKRQNAPPPNKKCIFMSCRVVLISIIAFKASNKVSRF